MSKVTNEQLQQAYKQSKKNLRCYHITEGELPIKAERVKRPTCVVDGEEYTSMTEASVLLGISYSVLRHRVYSRKYPNYYLE